MTPNERDAFEAWVSAGGRGHMLGRNRPNGWYLDLTIEAWWTGWQAARAAKPAAPEQATCLHRLADMRNEQVESGYMCLDCGALFAAADHSAAPPQQRDESKSAANARRYEWLRNALDRDISKYIDDAIAITHSKGETT